jgi:hypothetical protein
MSQPSFEGGQINETKIGNNGSDAGNIFLGVGDRQGSRGTETPDG